LFLAVALDVELMSAAVAAAAEAGRSVDEGYLVLAEQEGDAVGEALDNGVLAGEQGGEGELHVADLDAVGAEVRLRFGEALAGVEQRLGRDAADVEAGAAGSPALVDAGDLHAELRRPDGTDVPPRPRPDHYQVKYVGHRALHKSTNHRGTES